MVSCVTKAEPVIGYLHRGIEKMCENRTYLQVVPLTDRLDYVGSMYANWAYCRAVERLAGIRVPERAEYMRVIVCEMQRIASHMMALGSSAADTGAATMFIYAFDERERIIELFEELCGARLTYNYVRPGGVRSTLPEGWTEQLLDVHHQAPPGARRDGSSLLRQRDRPRTLEGRRRAVLPRMRSRGAHRARSRVVRA